jgi:hypothetical protein
VTPMTCPDCARDAEHCHGTLVRLADGTLECTDQSCLDTGRERHELVVPALPAG